MGREEKLAYTRKAEREKRLVGRQKQEVSQSLVLEQARKFKYSAHHAVNHGGFVTGFPGVSDVYDVAVSLCPLRIAT